MLLQLAPPAEAKGTKHVERVRATHQEKRSKRCTAIAAKFEVTAASMFFKSHKE